VEVCNSFEMDYKVVDGAIKIDMDYFEIKLEQCASIIPLAIFFYPEPLSPIQNPFHHATPKPRTSLLMFSAHFTLTQARSLTERACFFPLDR